MARNLVSCYFQNLQDKWSPSLTQTDSKIMKALKKSLVPERSEKRSLLGRSANWNSLLRDLSGYLQKIELFLNIRRNILFKMWDGGDGCRFFRYSFLPSVDTQFYGMRHGAPPILCYVLVAPLGSTRIVVHGNKTFMVGSLLYHKGFTKG